VTCSYGSNKPRENDKPSLNFSEKEALISRIDRLESLLLSAATNADFCPLNLPFHDIAQVPDTSVASCRNSLADNVPQIENESNYIDELSEEFGVLRVDSNQTLYHGGQHWVSTMFQVRGPYYFRQTTNNYTRSKSSKIIWRSIPMILVVLLWKSARLFIEISAYCEDRIIHSPKMNYLHLSHHELFLISLWHDFLTLLLTIYVRNHS
jgi:hypothetical protein